MRECLLFDHGEMYSDENIQHLITSEITLNKVYYNRYYDGDIEDMLTNLKAYIVDGIFTRQIVNIVILAAAKALSVNMCIYKNNGDRAILYMQQSNPPSTCDIYLKYSNEHYDAIVTKFPLRKVQNYSQAIDTGKGHYNPKVSHLLGNDQSYFNNIGIDFTLCESSVIVNDNIANIKSSTPVKSSTEKCTD